MQSLEHTTPEGIKFRYQPVLVADPADTQWGYIRSPYLARLGKNRMICSLYTGGPTEPDPENHSMYAESLDNGATWSKPRILFVNRRRSCHASTFFHGFDRPFAFVHTMHPYTYAQEVRTNFSWFDAEDDSWSVPSTVRGRCAFRAMPGMLAANGDAVFPVYWAECCNSARPFVPSLPEWSSDWKLKHVEPYTRMPAVSSAAAMVGKLSSRMGTSQPGVDLWGTYGC